MFVFDCGDHTRESLTGNGHEDLGVAKYLATLPAAVIVLDCLPNMNAQTVSAKTVPLVKYARIAALFHFLHSFRACTIRHDYLSLQPRDLRYLRANGHAATPIVLAEIPPKCESDWFNTATLRKSKRVSCKTHARKDHDA